jgi:hypothetical protein
MSSFYPLIPTREDWLERRIRELEKQVRELQAGRRLSGASFRGGAFRFLDDEGQPRYTLGHVDLSGEIGGLTEAYGNFTYGDGGAMVLAFRKGDRGQAFPPIDPRVTDPAFFKTVTSSTFQRMWYGPLDWPTQEVIIIAGWVQVDANTVAEAKLVDLWTSTETAVLVMAGGAGGATKYMRWHWLHPAKTGIYDPRDRAQSLALDLQVRRASGTGSVFVWEPQYWMQTSLWLADDSFVSTDGGGQWI